MYYELMAISRISDPLKTNKEATKIVGGTLAEKGFDVQRQTIEHAVQAAYEKSDLTPTVDPNREPQTGVVVHD